ncbi:pyridoxamine 5'-phosphate oxidase family protein [Halogeometricum sp. CBA1124]|uniref:pyridoxamine 5'-phosphate oxidase family protein n=1 Tax=Halogeometricum sp. CBA1124 TaxID=2668071 RepID=UPI00142B7359|nr:pyridoxamine 5'-phosphate oxidase family protein [Halogeometricum sp. CBA1124]MUV59143.1 pyridoxamine 5'-phosphate oxidase family protein [Halogeometricum sp. CBA1124]
MVVEMTPSAVDALLTEAGSGVLSLADGAETYAVPESFGYDGDALYFQLVYHETSRKMAFVRATEVATFTVYTDDPAESVLVRGRLERVPDADRAAASAAMADNAEIPALNVYPDTEAEDLSMAFYRLIPETVSGRELTRSDGEAD